jgi:hypothetical protein
VCRELGFDGRPLVAGQPALQSLQFGHQRRALGRCTRWLKHHSRERDGGINGLDIETWRNRRRRVGIDELHLQRSAVAADEQELIAFGKPVLDQRGRERCEQVLIDGPLQRARAHRRREALVEQELQCRGFPLDRPLAMA